MKPEPNYFYLNIGDSWPTFALTNLEIAADGALQLRALPRLVGSLPERVADLPLPQAPGGIVQSNDTLYFTEPERHLVWRIDPCDPTETPRPAPCFGGKGREPGRFKNPRGILTLPGRGLLIADSGNNRLQLIDPQTSQVRQIWDGRNDAEQLWFHQPWSLAADAAQNVYVANAGDHSLQKVDQLGRIDADFRASVTASGVLTDPVAVSITWLAGEEYLLVLDRGLTAVVIYTLSGTWQKTLTTDVLQNPLTLAVSEQALYVGDNGPERQTVLQFDLPSLDDEELSFVGTAVGYQGQISALYTHQSHTIQPPWCINDGPSTRSSSEKQPNELLLSPGQGMAPLTLQEKAGYRSCGFAVAGPFDYRSRPVNWHGFKAFSEALPPHTHLRFFFFLGEPPCNPSPSELADWLDNLPPALNPCDALPEALTNWSTFPPDNTSGTFGSFVTEQGVKRPKSAEACSHISDDLTNATYCWLGLMLAGNGQATPRLSQIQLQFDHKSYLPFLPGIFSENKESRAFMLPLLSLFESVFEEHESQIANLAALFDPWAAPAEFLDWLAGWLAEDIKEEWSVERQRQLIAEAFATYAQRGTVAGLRRRLQLFADVQAHILEPVLHTHLWSLGETSTLGFDTMLASAQPQGAVLGSTATLDQSHIITNDEYGAPLFEEVAHQFVVQVYRGQVSTPERVAVLRQVIEREKPAHTAYHLCFIKPAMRVGFQARVGIDTVVAGPPETLRLDQPLRRRHSLPGVANGRIGERSRLGLSTRIQQ